MSSSLGVMSDFHFLFCFPSGLFVPREIDIVHIEMSLSLTLEFYIVHI